VESRTSDPEYKLGNRLKWCGWNDYSEVQKKEPNSLWEGNEFHCALFRLMEENFGA
jgi:hypothetical protein